MVYIVSHLPYPAAGYLLTLLGCTGAGYGRVLARRKEQAGARALSADSLLQGEVEFSAFQPQRLCNERGSRLGGFICPDLSRGAACLAVAHARCLAWAVAAGS